MRAMHGTPPPTAIIAQYYEALTVFKAPYKVIYVHYLI